MEAYIKPEISGLTPFYTGKVRDLYDLGDRFLIVASDRISAFDVIMQNGVPGKGIVLTQISKFWFDYLGEEYPNHIISFDVEDVPEIDETDYAKLRGRIMLCKKLTILPVECIVRGYLTGSGLKSYKKDGTVCGIELPAGLVESSKLPEVIFTPSTKATEGHDENISFEQSVEIVGRENAEWLKKASLEVYEKGRAYAESKGIILCDTKFEFGTDAEGNIILADEVLTPDSSRFWQASLYKEGQSQDSFDKQILRDYLETLDWDKNPPGPTIPADIVAKIRARYVEAVEMLAGDEFAAEMKKLLADYA